MATLEEITERLQAVVGDDAGLGKSVKFDFRGDGCIHVDGGRVEGGAVTNLNRPADCTVTLSKSDFEDLARGRLDPAMAMMRGRMKVAGDFTVAMKLREILGRAGG